MGLLLEIQSCSLLIFPTTLAVSQMTFPVKINAINSGSFFQRVLMAFPP